MLPSRWLMLSAGLLVAGCGTDKFPIAPVSGRVTFNGKPLPGAHVLFQPVAAGTEIEVGPESAGRTDNDGKFSLSTIAPERKGASVGKNRVSVTIIEEEQLFGGGGGGTSNDEGYTGVVKYTLPQRYRHGTELTVDVPSEGTNTLELTLTSP